MTPTKNAQRRTQRALSCCGLNDEAAPAAPKFELAAAAAKTNIRSAIALTARPVSMSGPVATATEIVGPSMHPWLRGPSGTTHPTSGSRRPRLSDPRVIRRNGGRSEPAHPISGAGLASHRIGR
jgi:hypothetical protein